MVERRLQDGTAGRTNIIEGMTIPFGNPSPKSTTLLMHFDGDLADKTGLNTPAIYGTETYQDGKFKNALKLNGSSCVKIPRSDAVVLGTSDFTIAGWFYWDGTTTGGSYPRFFSCQYRYSSSYAYQGIFCQITASTKSIDWKVATSYSSAAVDAATGQTAPVNEWFHLAIVRSGTTLTFYYNGTSKATGTIGATASVYQHSSASFKIGAGTNESSSNDTPINFLSGAVDEFIIAKEAIWTSNFTPPDREYR